MTEVVTLGADMTQSFSQPQQFISRRSKKQLCVYDMEEHPSPSLAAFSDADLRHELQLDDHTPPPPGQVITTKLPPWGWALIVLGVLLVAGAIIAVPLVLTHNQHPAPSITPPGSVTVTPNVRPIFPSINSQAVLAQTAVPPSDGLTKSAYQVTQVAATQLGFLAVGQSSKSAFYVINLSTGAVSAPSILVSPSSTTINANAYGSWMLATTDGVNWSKCTGDLGTATSNCSAVSWPSPGDLDLLHFAGTQWVGQPTDILFSFDATLHVTMQNESALVCRGNSALPGQGEILATFYTVNQTYALFGAVDGSSNTINYVVYVNLGSPDCNTLYALNFDPDAERLVYADMNYNGQFLLVLTSQRLIMYSHSTPQSPFVLKDVMGLDTGLTASLCALDRLHTTNAGELWCVLSTDQQYSVILPFNVATGTFTLDQGRQVPLPTVPPNTYFDAFGPSAIHWDAASGKLFVLQSDSNGNADVVVIDPSRL